MRRSRSTSVPACGSTSATRRRIELVPQSIAATREAPGGTGAGEVTGAAVAPGSRVSGEVERGVMRPSVPRGQQVQRSGRHARRARATSASSPSGLTPGPAAERVAHEDVQALHARGHPARRDAVDLLDVAERLALREVVLVRAPVGGGELLVLGEPLRHLLHDAVRLERRRGRDRARAREVEGRGERRAVLEPRRRADDERAPARAPRGDADDTARRAPELLRERLEVALGDDGVRVVGGDGQAGVGHGTSFGSVGGVGATPAPILPARRSVLVAGRFLARGCGPVGRPRVVAGRARTARDLHRLPDGLVPGRALLVPTDRSVRDRPPRSAGRCRRRPSPGRARATAAPPA